MWTGCLHVVPLPSWPCFVPVSAPLPSCSPHPRRGWRGRRRRARFGARSWRSSRFSRCALSGARRRRAPGGPRPLPRSPSATTRMPFTCLRVTRGAGSWSGPFSTTAFGSGRTAARGRSGATSGSPHSVVSPQRSPSRRRGLFRHRGGRRFAELRFGRRSRGPRDRSGPERPSHLRRGARWANPHELCRPRASEPSAPPGRSGGEHLRAGQGRGRSTRHTLLCRRAPVRRRAPGSTGGCQRRGGQPFCGQRQRGWHGQAIAPDFSGPLPGATVAVPSGCR